MNKSNLAKVLFAFAFLMLAWYLFYGQTDFSLNFNGEDIDDFFGLGEALGGAFAAILAIGLTLAIVALVMLGLSFLLVGVLVLVGGCLALAFSPLLLPLMLVLLAVGLLRKRARQA